MSKDRPTVADLRSMYEDKFMSALKISKLLDVSDVTVFRWLRQAGVSIRTSKESRPPKQRLAPKPSAYRKANAIKGAAAKKKQARARLSQNIGKRFGRVALDEIDFNVKGNPKGVCSCDCGRTHCVSIYRIINARYEVMCNSCRRMSDNPVGAEIRSYIGMSASRRNLEWSLPQEEYLAIVTGDCTYCGAPPGKRYKRSNRNGIDRVDSSIGYVTGNCVTCCTDCNKAKMKRNVLEFLEWAKRVGSRSDDLMKSFSVSEAA